MANNGKKQGKKSGGKMILLIVEIIIVLVLFGVLLLFWWLEKPNKESEEGEKGGPLINISIDEQDLEISQKAQENEVIKGYRNVVLFGVDSRKGALTKGTLSDCIIIASINLETNDVKLCSIYRDTLLNLSNDKYGKCNSAYS